MACEIATDYFDGMDDGYFEDINLTSPRTCEGNVGELPIVGLSYDQLEEIYPHVVDTTLTGIRTCRFMWPQSDPRGFIEIRGSEYSIGSSSAGNAVGLGQGTAGHFLEERRLCVDDPEYASEKKTDLMLHNGDNLEAGQKREVLSQMIYQHLTGFKCYEGGFFRFALHKDKRFSGHPFDWLNSSPDRVVLCNELPELDFEKMRNMRGHPERWPKVHRVSNIRTPVEFKNPIYKVYDKPPASHVVQCVIHALACGTRSCDYLATHFSSSSGKLEGLIYATIYLEPTFVDEMEKRLEDFSLALLEKRKLTPPYGTAADRNTMLELLEKVPVQIHLSYGPDECEKNLNLWSLDLLNDPDFVRRNTSPLW